MQLHEDDLKAHQGDRFWSGVMGACSVIMGVTTLSVVPLLDITNPAWHLLLTIPMVVSTAGLCAFGAFLAYRNRRGQYYEGQPHDAQTSEVLWRANTRLNAAYLYLVIAATLFAWSAWWQDLRFSVESFPTLIAAAFLSAAAVSRLQGSKSLRELTTMLCIKANP